MHCATWKYSAQNTTDILKLTWHFETVIVLILKLISTVIYRYHNMPCTTIAVEPGTWTAAKLILYQRQSVTPWKLTPWKVIKLLTVYMNYNEYTYIVTTTTKIPVTLGVLFFQLRLRDTVLWYNCWTHRLATILMLMITKNELKTGSFNCSSFKSWIWE